MSMEGLKIHVLEMVKDDFARLSDKSNNSLDRINILMRALGRLQVLGSYNIIDNDAYVKKKTAFFDECKRIDAISNEADLDRKFRIFAWNRSGTKKEPYTQADGMFFLARDPAFRSILPMYRDECARLGAGQGQLDSLDLLIGRVDKYAQDNSSKLPDADPVKEPHLFKPNETEL